MNKGVVFQVYFLCMFDLKLIQIDIRVLLTDWQNVYGCLIQSALRHFPSFSKGKKKVTFSNRHECSKQFVFFFFLISLLI